MPTKNIFPQIAQNSQKGMGAELLTEPTLAAAEAGDLRY